MTIHHELAFPILEYKFEGALTGVILGISVKNTEIDVGRCLVNVPVCASRTEDAVNDGRRPVEEETAQPSWVRDELYKRKDNRGHSVVLEWKERVKKVIDKPYPSE